MGIARGVLACDPPNSVKYNVKESIEFSDGDL